MSLLLKVSFVSTKTRTIVSRITSALRLCRIQHFSNSKLKGLYLFFLFVFSLESIYQSKLNLRITDYRSGNSHYSNIFKKMLLQNNNSYAMCSCCMCPQSIALKNSQKMIQTLKNDNSSKIPRGLSVHVF